MKKKIMIGAAAIALIAMNVLAFTSYARIGERPGGIRNNPYQTVYNCSDFSVRLSCTWIKTNEQCLIACDGSMVIPVPTDPTIVDR